MEVKVKNTILKNLIIELERLSNCVINAINIGKIKEVIESRYLEIKYHLQKIKEEIAKGNNMLSQEDKDAIINFILPIISKVDGVKYHKETIFLSRQLLEKLDYEKLEEIDLIIEDINTGVLTDIKPNPK